MRIEDVVVGQSYRLKKPEEVPQAAWYGISADNSNVHNGKPIIVAEVEPEWRYRDYPGFIGRVVSEELGWYCSADCLIPHYVDE